MHHQEDFSLSPAEMLAEGIALLRAPHCAPEAIRVMNGALTRLRDLMGSQDVAVAAASSSGNLSQKKSSMDATSRSKSETVIYSTVNKMHRYTQVEVPFPVDDRFYLHSYALLYEADVSSLLHDVDCLDFMCATTAYNLAVAFHSWGLRENNDKMLQKAMAFYQTCLGVIGRNQSCSSSFAFLALAALNNQSCICFEFGDMKLYHEIQRK